MLWSIQFMFVEMCAQSTRDLFHNYYFHVHMHVVYVLNDCGSHCFSCSHWTWTPTWWKKGQFNVFFAYLSAYTVRLIGSVIFSRLCQAGSALLWEPRQTNHVPTWRQGSPFPSFLFLSFKHTHTHTHEASFYCTTLWHLAGNMTKRVSNTALNSPPHILECFRSG